MLKGTHKKCFIEDEITVNISTYTIGFYADIFQSQVYLIIMLPLGSIDKDRVISETAL